MACSEGAIKKISTHILNFHWTTAGVSYTVSLVRWNRKQWNEMKIIALHFIFFILSCTLKSSYFHSIILDFFSHVDRMRIS